MLRRTIFIVVIACASVSVAADGAGSLADAVKAINEQAAKLPESCGLNPLTEDEVSKVIEAFARPNPLPGEEYAHLKSLSDEEFRELRRGGIGPFKELGKHGSIRLGGAVLTSEGRLPFEAIIHVAGINMLWRASEWSIRQCVQNAMALANDKGFQSIAFPLIGAGSGGFNQERAKAIMEDELGKIDYAMDVRLVVFKKGRRAGPT
jgi:O-acetyl-ADP-ribose deacetylase